MSAATNVVTMAGSFSQSGYTNGAGSVARFSGASGVCVSQGMVFVGDTSNQRIRNIAFNHRHGGPHLPCRVFAGLVQLDGTNYFASHLESLSLDRPEPGEREQILPGIFAPLASASRGARPAPPGILLSRWPGNAVGLWRR
jgi:hypothetical protein